MVPRRGVLAAAVIAASIVPAASANAAPDVATGERPAAVSALATDAARLLDEELALLRDAGRPGSGPDVTRARQHLHTVDVQGNGILDQFDRLAVELAPSVRATLALLPAPPAGPADPSRSETRAPQPVVYEAAIADLDRIAATPNAVAPAAPNDGQGDGQPSLGLLAVAAGALLLFGLATRSNATHRADEELEAMAWSDGLTGVANRRRLDRDLAFGVTAEVGPTSVIMIDIDRFKAINDSFGHQAGDEVLRQVSAMLAAQVREHDVVYRYGGEEFCVLLAGATAEDARAIGDRIVQAAHAISLPDGNRVTVSVGVAAGEPVALVETLESADRAMLEAKTHGRDRVHAAAQLQPA